ncbi:hypothetical protein QTO34_012586 [Cnephaeus nilssonii]|uniref:Uncharacterized protein n=1 Tax=Cnephaeus nilssonii TaxID=3371016 RepID=A0AA40HBR9_CNENI|nr:hypothetical protein QTO34_012586 [Eptesicus nilssonii]
MLGVTYSVQVKWHGHLHAAEATEVILHVDDIIKAAPRKGVLISTLAFEKANDRLVGKYRFPPRHWTKIPFKSIVIITITTTTTIIIVIVVIIIIIIIYITPPAELGTSHLQTETQTENCPVSPRPHEPDAQGRTFDSEEKRSPDERRPHDVDTEGLTQEGSSSGSAGTQPGRLS